MGKARGWLLPAALGVLAVTALRIVLLTLNRTDLFVDEAQYWLWGQHPALGYYSKPPMIGWVIGAVTGLAGSSTPFWVRLPAPLFHAVTALLLAGIAARAFGPRQAVVVAIAYITLPLATVGSLLISTDTIMFPFLAAALAAYLRLLDRPRAVTALTTGVFLGLAFLSKYAAAYYLVCAGLAALLLPSARPGRGAAALVMLAFFLTASPNIAWNIAHGFVTLGHTLDNTGWARAPSIMAGLNPTGLGWFFASQFAVFGPVLFSALLLAGAGWRNHPQTVRLLLIFSLPVIGLVCGQALLSKAYANWAAVAYLAASLAVPPLLMARARRWLIASFIINGSFALAVPLATTAVDAAYPGRPQQLLQRYLGRAAMSRQILAAARTHELSTVLATDRDVLADLFYTGRHDKIAIFALPSPGRPANHYVFKFPYPGGDAPVLLVVPESAPVPCPDTAVWLGRIAPDAGAYRARPQALYRLPPECIPGSQAAAP